MFSQLWKNVKTAENWARGLSLRYRDISYRKKGDNDAAHAV